MRVASVENYVPDASGPNFSSHVTAGVVPAAIVKAVTEAPFDAFVFGAEGIAIYQFGNFGAAQKRFWAT